MTSFFLMLTLLVVFQAKHFLADYPLQTRWMLGKFRKKEWVLPLMAHAGVHALFTAAISGVILGYSGPHVFLALALGGFDFSVHFLMDRMKASPKLMGRWKPLSPEEYVRNVEIVEGPWVEPVDEGVERSSLRLYIETLFPAKEEHLAAQKRLRDNTRFWWALGFDQMVHHLTDYVVIAFLMMEVMR